MSNIIEQRPSSILFCVPQTYNLMSATLKLKEEARTYQHRDFNEDLNVF